MNTIIHNTTRRLLTLLLIAMMLVTIMAFAGCNETVAPNATIDPTPTTEASSAPASETPDETQEVSKTCSLAIKCTTILDNDNLLAAGVAAYETDDGIILDMSDIEIIDGESVFDLLIRICSEQNIEVDYEYMAEYACNYIKGIANLSEKMYGDQSGWMFKVNGEMPPSSADGVILENGDVVEFLYSCNYGEDLN